MSVRVLRLKVARKIDEPSSLGEFVWRLVAHVDSARSLQLGNHSGEVNHICRDWNVTFAFRQLNDEIGRMNDLLTRAKTLLGNMLGNLSRSQI